MNKHYTIGIIVFDGVPTSEVTSFVEVFGIAGKTVGFNADILLIGIEPQTSIRTDEGIQLVVDTSMADAPMLDILLVPGARDVSHLLENEHLQAFIRQHTAFAEWIGSVCAGAFVLGNAGVLDGRQATTWFGGESYLQESFPAIHVVQDQPVVVDHRRITANGRLVGYQAALVLLGKLMGIQHAKDVYLTLGINRLDAWDNIEASISQL